MKSRSGMMLRQGAFTLIEILIVLVIVGVFATSVVPSLHRFDSHADADSVVAWQRQAEWAEQHSMAEGRPWVWEIGEDSARLLVRAERGWQVADNAPQPVSMLVGGIKLSRLEIDGAVVGAGSRIVFGGVPPLFAIELQGDGQRWLITGRPSGFVDLERMP